MDKKRPNLMTPEVIQAVAKNTLPRLMEWLEYESGATDEEELQRVQQEVAEALRDSFGDAYAAARHLDDRYGWAADAELVSLLEGMQGEHYRVLDDHLQAWVAETGLKPDRQLGDRVRFVPPYKGKGEIVAIDQKRGTYTVFDPELGHVRSGTGTHGIIMAYEDVEGVT